MIAVSIVTLASMDVDCGTLLMCMLNDEIDVTLPISLVGGVMPSRWVQSYLPPRHRWVASACSRGATRRTRFAVLFCAGGGRFETSWRRVG